MVRCVRWSQGRSWRVLNAFRHRGDGHATASFRSITNSECSTPFGIEAMVTAPRVAGRRSHAGAQRLSASRRWSQLDKGSVNALVSVLNAFRHRGAGHTVGTKTPTCSSHFLNPFRHPADGPPPAH